MLTQTLKKDHIVFEYNIFLSDIERAIILEERVFQVGDNISHLLPLNLKLSLLLGVSRYFEPISHKIHCEEGRSLGTGVGTFGLIRLQVGIQAK